MFNTDVLATIASSIRAGQYNLLLGAGVSLDSANAKGKLPSGETFRSDLCKLKGARATSSLQRVFSTLTANEVSTEVTARFEHCSPGPTVKKITNFLWRRIYTFNVDDALEAAYKANQSYQLSQVFHFDDPYEEIIDRSTVPIIHLHGWAGAPALNYVFSLSEYVRQIRSINPWMVVLTQFLRVEPFIIAGTSLDEVDLEYYLAYRTAVTSRSDRGPSILVEPFPDHVTERDCQKYGLLLFKGTTEEFLDYLDTSVPNRPTPLELISPQTRNLFPAGTSKRSILSFSSDFELVPESSPKNLTVSSFMFGLPPTWSDLSGNLDISRHMTATVVADVEAHLTARTPSPRVIFLADVTGAGKTTLLRRVAFELAGKRSAKVLLCSSISRIDSQITSALLDLIDDPVVLIVDNIADQANAIADTVERLERKDIVVLCADRGYRSSYVINAFSDLDLKTISGLALDSVESQRLIAMYLNLGLLGHPDALTSPSSFAGQIQDDPIAIAACRILNDFRPLTNIIASLRKDTNPQDRDRYLVAALAQFCFRGGVRYEILATVSGREGWEDQFETTHPMPLAYLDRSDRSYVVPLNATLASTILHQVSTDNPEQVFHTFVTLGNALAPYVNRGSIRRRSPEARLSSRLFDYDQVVHDFLGNLAPSFYNEIQPLWQWNSRYWDQVALLNLARYEDAPTTQPGKDALTQAVQHARHAVSIEVHPFSLTTLGTVLLVQMAEEPDLRNAIYDEAYARLTEAIDRERHWAHRNPHSFVSLFKGTTRFIALGGRPSPTQRDHLHRLLDEASNVFRRDAGLTEAVAELDADLSHS